jgi:hypothetical protein
MNILKSFTIPATGTLRILNLSNYFDDINTIKRISNYYNNGLLVNQSSGNNSQSYTISNIKYTLIY